MSNKNLLHRNKLDDFKRWLGDRALPPIGKWELVRWKVVGWKGYCEPMCIVFDTKKSQEYLSCNDEALTDVLSFIEEDKKVSSVDEPEDCLELPTLEEVVSYVNSHFIGDASPIRLSGAVLAYYFIYRKLQKKERKKWTF